MSGGGKRGRKDDLPRRVGEVISPALDRIADSDEARAYAAWARAVGEPVAAGTRPKAFRRGQLTVECASSVWANELTYLGPQILRRMDEVAAGHPVTRFRFVLGRLPGRPAADGPEGASLGHGDTDGQGSGVPAAKQKRRQQTPAPGPSAAARAGAEGVQDDRLRAAIEASLRRSSEEPPEAPVRGTPHG